MSEQLSANLEWLTSALYFLVNMVSIGLASGTVSVTVAQSEIFSGFRKSLAPVPFLGKLVSCPYCLGHWAAFALCIYNNWANGQAFPALLWPGLLAWLGATAVSALVAGLIGRLYGD